MRNELHDAIQNLKPGQTLKITNHETGECVTFTGPVKEVSPFRMVPALIIAALCGGIIIGVLGGILSLIN